MNNACFLFETAGDFQWGAFTQIFKHLLNNLRDLGLIS